jgi:hydroxyacylglutathione hydrolase
MVLPSVPWLTRQRASSTAPSAPRPATRKSPSAVRFVPSSRRNGVEPQDAVHPDFSLTVSIFPSLQRNYAFLVHERVSRETVVVDPHDAGPIIALARAQGLAINHVFNTHHHNCAGNLALKRATGCKIHGPAAEADRIPGIDIAYKGGETFGLGRLTGNALSVPGHTIGHIALWFPGAATLFCGDTLTPLGCGYLVDGTPHEMWRSLDIIRHLPPETLIYSGFECAQPNGRFALSIDRKNLWLQTRMKRIDEACKAGRATVPTKLEDEHTTNPFLRVDDPRLAVALGLVDATPIDVFIELRRRRDSFHFLPN